MAQIARNWWMQSGPVPRRLVGTRCIPDVPQTRGDRGGGRVDVAGTPPPPPLPTGVGLTALSTAGVCLVRRAPPLQHLDSPVELVATAPCVDRPGVVHPAGHGLPPAARGAGGDAPADLPRRHRRARGTAAGGGDAPPHPLPPLARCVVPRRGGRPHPPGGALHRRRCRCRRRRRPPPAARRGSHAHPVPSGARAGSRRGRGGGRRLDARGVAPTSTPPAGGATSEYVGPLSLGYSFRYPTTWSANKKPIKTHLSEVIVSAPKGSSASVGLVVDGPLKIGSIEEFGTPDAVGAKVLALERKKDSTKDVRLVRTASETLGVGGGAAAAAGVGQPAGLGNGVAYIVEYVVDSSRGVKHFVAKATVAAGQLYVMTATCKEDEFEAARGGLETVLASLRVAPKV
ncbi:hypothetical protein BU14_0098s0016 [Porphyra umbilicalis]|uniref:PsbP C-terminal domain-containing protein n=1 Tax=Porphyra umbilicalis TaxID=2786 RepID=A0A1X6PDH3_PORUM|nr:hypothetical protein BU14_0098s0016 [Porphyra umbilicalis]|eukprot:OSX78790.1 hypothetical protein BU14_0098s0016 [Porphyra umbilicalis]